MSFDMLREAVERGMNTEHMGIPIGFPILGDEIMIRPSTGYLIGGYTGSGKTSFLDDAFIINPLEWLNSNPNSGIDIEIMYFSMERKTLHKLAKWVGRKMFLDKGVILGVNKLLGMVSPNKKINTEEWNYFLEYEEYINYLLSKITVIQGAQNPMGIKKAVDAWAEKNGKIVTPDPDNKPYERIYVPNNPNKFLLIIYDHVGITTKEKRDEIVYHQKKEIIDLLSADARRFRDFYGFSYCMVSQFNRDIANPIRIKNGSVEPMLEDFKDTAGTQEDADVVFGLFDAIRYQVAYPTGKDQLGYELSKFRFENGIKKYRSLHILKNTYGIEDIGIGLAFQPQVGHFKELPRAREITSMTYDQLNNNNYFLRASL